MTDEYNGMKESLNLTTVIMHNIRIDIMSICIISHQIETIPKTLLSGSTCYTWSDSNPVLLGA